MPGIARSLTALPLSHAFGLLVTVVGFHEREPHSSVLMRWFHPGTWLELADEHRVQIAAVVPSMLSLLLAELLEEHDLSELRYVVSGAAPLLAETDEELRRRLPGVELREGYQRFNDRYLWATVVVLAIVATLIQFIGNRVARGVDRRRHASV